MRRCRVYQVRASTAGVMSIVPGAIRVVLLAAIMLVLDSCASHGGATQQVATSSSPDASSPPSAPTPGASATSTSSGRGRRRLREGGNAGWHRVGHERQDQVLRSQWTYLRHSRP